MKKEKPNYYVVSFSGGKDSTAMLLRLMELNEPIDEVVCCDTYKEFPDMYKHIDEIRKVVTGGGIKFTLLKADKDFDYYMFDFVPEKRKENNTKGKGLSWATNRVRWCTGYLKVRIVNKYFSQLRKQYNVIQYLGIAADEEYRLDRKDNQRKGLEFPLAEWGWTEKDCLEYCYSKGYKWGGLYDQFKRVSCWCCPLQPLEALRTLRKEYPDLWNELRSMDNRTWRQFRTDYSVRDLDIKFDLEDEFKNEGKSVRNKEFFDEYRRRKLGNKLNN